MTDVLNARHASGAKKSTKTLRETDAWLASRDNLVLNILKYKYEQVPIFQQTLQHTAHHQYRHTVSSTYWGTGNYGTGQNIFGKLLHTLVTNKLHIQPPCTVQKSPSTVPHPNSPPPLSSTGFPHLSVVPTLSTSDPSKMSSQTITNPTNSSQKHPTNSKTNPIYSKTNPTNSSKTNPTNSSQAHQPIPNPILPKSTQPILPKPTQPIPNPTQPIPKPFLPKSTQLILPKPTQPIPKPTQPIPKPTKPILPKPTQPIPKPTQPIPKPTQPIPKPTKPIPKPFLPKPTQPILPKPTQPIPKPILPKQTKPIPKPTQPIPKPTKPIPKPTQPIPKPFLPKPTQPILSKPTQPIPKPFLPKPTKPILPKPTQPIPKPTQPIPKPILPKSTQLILPKPTKLIRTPPSSQIMFPQPPIGTPKPPSDQSQPIGMCHSRLDDRVIRNDRVDNSRLEHMCSDGVSDYSIYHDYPLYSLFGSSTPVTQTNDKATDTQWVDIVKTNTPVQICNLSVDRSVIKSEHSNEMTKVDNKFKHQNKPPHNIKSKIQSKSEIKDQCNMYRSCKKTHNFYSGNNTVALTNRFQVLESSFPVDDTYTEMADLDNQDFGNVRKSIFTHAQIKFMKRWRKQKSKQKAHFSSQNTLLKLHSEQDTASIQASKPDSEVVVKHAIKSNETKPDHENEMQQPHSFVVKLSTNFIKFDFQCSTITISDLLSKLHESMHLSSNPIISVNNKVITDTVNYQIRKTDVIEIGVAGLGGGRKRGWKGAQIHPDHPCTLCSVCNKSKPSDSFIHLSTYEQAGKISFVEHVRSSFPNICDSDCICEACRLNLMRNLVQDNKQTKKKKSNTCIISHLKSLSCTNDGMLCNFTLSDVLDCYKIDDTDVNISDIFLCRSHYNHVYKSINEKNCAICASRLRQTSENKLHRPYYFDQYDLIKKDIICRNSLFSQNDSHKIDNLTDTSPICIFCHRKLVSVQKLRKIISDFDGNDQDMLAKCHNHLEEMFHNFWEININLSKFMKTLQYAISIFMNNKPVLMDTLHNHYCNLIENGDSVLKSERLFVSAVQDFFGKLIITSNLNDDSKFSQMIRWHDLDVVSALHKAQLELSSTKQTETVSDGNQVETNTCIMILEQASEILRNKLQNFEQKIDSSVLDMTELNFMEIINEIDPLIWNFFYKTTLSYTEKLYWKDKYFDWNCIHDKLIYENVQDNLFRKMKRLSIISNAMVTLNRQTNFPLQLLFAEFIDKYTKSSADCLQFFNNFGVCSSYDTIRRHETTISSSRLFSKLIKREDLNTFTYVSVDNVSFWSSNARVRSSEKERGLNCTSYMSCQPKPKSIKLSPDDQYINDVVSVKDDEGNHFDIKPIPYENNKSFFLSCLYNIDNELHYCKRDSDGNPINLSDQQREDILLKLCKDRILHDLLESINFFESLPDEYFKRWVIDNSFENYEDRFRKTLNFNYIASDPEIMAMVKLFGRPINIYKKEGDNISLKHQYFSQSINFSGSIDILCDMGTNSRYVPLVNAKFLPQLITLNNDESEMNWKLNNKLSYSEILNDSPYQFIYDKHKRVNRERSITKKLSQCSSMLSHMSIGDMDNSSLVSNQKDITFEDIQQIETETLAESNKMKLSIFTYMMSKFSAKLVNENSMPGIKVFLSKQTPQQIEQSEYMYIDIINENADSRETMENVLERLYAIMGLNSHLKYLVVVGDGKTYDHLIKLKTEYGDSLNWLLPFPGDWHTMKNFAYVLIKTYGPCGLNDLLKIFHKGSTANSILLGKCWDKTHDFLLQVFEALFRYQLEMYMEYRKNDQHNDSEFYAQSFINVITSKLIPLLKSKPENINDQLIETLNKYQSIIDNSYNDFMAFIDDLSKVNENFKFWSDFIHKDCFVYVSLYLAIRSGNWSLRNYCMYKISNLFQVSDSKYYFRLLPRHLADMLNFPPHILDYFKNGGFNSNITGTQWSSIALDEMHEMTINKDIKIAFTTPSITNVRIKLLYLA